MTDKWASETHRDRSDLRNLRLLLAGLLKATSPAGNEWYVICVASLTYKQMLHLEESAQEAARSDRQG